MSWSPSWRCGFWWLVHQLVSCFHQDAAPSPLRTRNWCPSWSEWWLRTFPRRWWSWTQMEHPLPRRHQRIMGPATWGSTWRWEEWLGKGGWMGACKVMDFAFSKFLRVPSASFSLFTKNIQHHSAYNSAYKPCGDKGSHQLLIKRKGRERKGRVRKRERETRKTTKQ